MVTYLATLELAHGALQFLEACLQVQYPITSIFDIWQSWKIYHCNKHNQYFNLPSFYISPKHWTSMWRQNATVFSCENSKRFMTSAQFQDDVVHSSLLGAQSYVVFFFVVRLKFMRRIFQMAYHICWSSTDNKRLRSDSKIHRDLDIFPVWNETQIGNRTLALPLRCLYTFLVRVLLKKKNNS